VQIKSFKDMYIAELQELMSVEQQRLQSLQKLAQAASNPALKTALDRHREQTQRQQDRLNGILQKHGANPQEHTDQGMQGLLGETDKMQTILKGDDLRDAGLIASAQKLKHYEIAAYGTAAALAGQLDLRDDQNALHQSLEEEKQFDIALSEIAKGQVNQDAVAL
jgi:ferritin-like metal-binding protein YciE